MSKSALKRRAREARLWLTDACFPLWSERGIGEHGLFRETLGLDHQPEDSATTRVRVQARQTYVFAEAARLGWEPETAADHVAMGIAALTGPALRPDGLAGRTLETATGRLADDTADLYDNAFALFALAAAMGSGVEVNNLAPHGNALVTHLDTLMHAPDGGYAETLPPGPKRHQNPHMHL
ncbi:MAG: AGE family epimerase/isomerase, partial [Hyphomonas sp.]|nr:AGE family epimerase/isomerase [Hyphomonas sp.]